VIGQKRRFGRSADVRSYPNSDRDCDLSGGRYVPISTKLQRSGMAYRGFAAAGTGFSRHFARQQS